jgi:hypothetical protein
MDKTPKIKITKPKEDESIYRNIAVWIIIGIGILNILWLLIYSVNPSFTQNKNTNLPNTSKVLLYSIILTLAILLLIALIKFTISRKSS